MTPDEWGDVKIEWVGRHMTKRYWQAKVNGVDLTRKFGSWMYEDKERGCFREVLPSIAAALQDRVREMERAERLKDKAEALQETQAEVEPKIFDGTISVESAAAAVSSAVAAA